MTLAITSFKERVNHYAQLQRVGAIWPKRQEITSMFGREFFQEVAEIAWKSLNIGSCSCFCCFCFYDVQVCLGMFFSSEKQSSKPSRSGSKLDVMSQSCKKYDKGDNHSIRVFVTNSRNYRLMACCKLASCSFWRTRGDIMSSSTKSQARS